MRRPDTSEYPAHFAKYVDVVPETDLLSVLETQPPQVRAFLAGVSSGRETFAYGPDKWTIRQVVGHVNDAERLFAYRTLCFSRGDQTELPGFDENAYVEHAAFNDRDLADLVDEFAHLRSANLGMFKALHEDQWNLSGVANGRRITVRALAYVMAGHVRHHLNILRERYGVTAGSQKD